VAVGKFGELLKQVCHATRLGGSPVSTFSREKIGRGKIARDEYHSSLRECVGANNSVFQNCKKAPLRG
jgi:hypothetical protein